MFSPAAGAELFTPQDGNGLNPLPAPPGHGDSSAYALFGLRFFVVPYAFAIAALITGAPMTAGRASPAAGPLGVVVPSLVSFWRTLAYDVLGWGGTGKTGIRLKLRRSCRG